MDRTQVLQAVRTFARQRPGLEFGNYGDVSAYRAELRGITRDLAEAQTLLGAIEHTGMTVEELLAGFDAFSGRLTCAEVNGAVRLEYCTGQYWPTEYRRAVCAVAASALWQYYRDDFSASAKAGESAGDAIRRKFRSWFGRGLASRWFR